MKLITIIKEMLLLVLDSLFWNVYMNLIAKEN